VVYGSSEVAGAYTLRDDFGGSWLGPNGFYLDQTGVPSADGVAQLSASTFTQYNENGDRVFVAKKQYSHWGNTTLTPGKTQRIYFLPVHQARGPTTGVYEAIGSIGHVELYAAKLYRAARGDI